MIKHIMKIIWTERRVNIWILLELILVFCILWFCADFLWSMSEKKWEQNNFDINHTYNLRISTKPNYRDFSEEEMLEKFDQIYRAIETHHAIEAASLSQMAIPYGTTYGSMGLDIDSVRVNFKTNYVSPSFFDVFKMPLLKDSGFAESTNDRAVIISGGRGDMLGTISVFEVEKIGDNRDPYIVLGVAGKVKKVDFQDYCPMMYSKLRNDEWNKLWQSDLSIRVKPAFDRRDFDKVFFDQMKERLEVGPFYLSSVTSFDELRAGIFKSNDYTNQFRSIYAVSLFLIVNIFLGVMGTFWFRIQTRRSEIGLRMALGSTKGGIRRFFLGESIILLLMASVIGAIISVNITMVDVLQEIGVPVIQRGAEGVSLSHIFINFGLTFLFLAIIVIIGVLYPAKKASDIQPSETLKAE